MNRLMNAALLPFAFGVCACMNTTGTLMTNTQSPAPEPDMVVTAAGDEIIVVEEPVIVDAPPAVYDEPAAEANAETIMSCAELELGRQLFDEQNWRDARVALTAALDQSLHFEEEKETLDMLTEINLNLFGSDSEDGDLTSYVVAEGDTLGKIADKFGTTWQMLRRVNGLASNNIRVGQKLKAPKGTLSLRVRKAKFAVDLMIDGAFVKRYRAGLGRNNGTPEGEFTVKNRIPHPQDGTFPYGHPQHRLGSHWLGLKGDPQYQGYGIHGCPVEQYNEIGTECSLGCVRVTNEDAEEIYEILPIGAKVVITKS